MLADSEFLRAVRAGMRDDTPKKLDSLRGELFEAVNIPRALPEEVLTESRGEIAYLGASESMDLNLYMLKGLPCFPTRCCRNSTDPGESK
jgi:hypothetical protein